MAEEAGYARRLAKSVAAVFTGLVAAHLMGFFLRVFLMRTLTPEEYGLFYATFAVVSLLVAFRELGLTPALIKHIPEFAVKRRFRGIKSAISVVALVQAVSSLLIAVLLFTFSDQIALTLIRTPGASFLLKILAIQFFFAGFYPLLQGVFQGFQRMRGHAAIEFSHIFLVFASAVLFVGVFGRGVEGLALAYLLASLIMLFPWLLFFKMYPQVFREKTSLSKPLTKKLLVFALPLFIAGICSMVVGYASTIMLAALHSPTEVGLFQMAQPIAQVLVYFSSALAIALFPMVSEMWAGRQGVLAPALHFLVKFSFILVVPAALIFIAFPEIVIRLIAGPDYLGGAVALQILAGAAIVLTLIKIMMATVSGIGKTVINMNAVFLMACTNLVANFLLIPRYGIEGAAVSMFFTYVLGLSFLTYHVKKTTKFPVPALPLVKASAGAALTLGIIFSLKSILELQLWPEAFAVMIPSLLFYGAWIILTGVLTKGDLAILKKIVPVPRWVAKVAERWVR